MTQPATSNQATDLMDHLTKQRKHVLGILEDLPEEAMRRPVLPTGWTTLDITARVPHVFEAFYPVLDEAAVVLDRAGQFLSAHLAGLRARTR
jgi:hypothetical protein